MGGRFSCFVSSRSGIIVLTLYVLFSTSEGCPRGLYFCKKTYPGVVAVFLLRRWCCFSGSERDRTGGSRVRVEGGRRRCFNETTDEWLVVWFCGSYCIFALFFFGADNEACLLPSGFHYLVEKYMSSEPRTVILVLSKGLCRG